MIHNANIYRHKMKGRCKNSNIKLIPGNWLLSLSMLAYSSVQFFYFIHWNNTAALNVSSSGEMLLLLLLGSSLLMLLVLVVVFDPATTTSSLLSIMVTWQQRDSTPMSVTYQVTTGLQKVHICTQAKKHNINHNFNRS